jgi:subtilisin family serine protease
MAAGHDGGPVKYPAAYRGVLSVGGHKANGEVAGYSSRGPSLALVAPGGSGPGAARLEGIYSTVPTYPTTVAPSVDASKAYAYLSGTSMAAPLATAAVALVLEQSPGLSPAQVWTRLAASAKRPDSKPFDDAFGFGVLDAQAALTRTDDAPRAWR